MRRRLAVPETYVLETLRMTTDTKTQCPICSYGPQSVETSDYGKRLHLNCPRCGEYKTTVSAANLARSRGAAPMLSGWIRSRNQRSPNIPEISTSNLDDIIGNFPSLTVIEKQTILLEALSRKSKYPGFSVPIESSLEYPIIWAENAYELEFHLASLISRNLVQAGSQIKAMAGQGAPEYIITAAGWSYLDETSRPRSSSTQVFVAMSFDNSLKPAWRDGIEPAIRRAGYKAFRTDAQPSVDRIDVQIMAEIKRSHLVVADVTHQRPGVYFEAGYAIGLGIPVYWCVRKDDLANIHFDTRQYNHIIWETPQDLESKLHDFIFAISGPATETNRPPVQPALPRAASGG